jgi:hypothetical protein
MAEQSGERWVTEEVAAELISLIVPDMDPELVQVMLSRAARSAAGGRADHEGHRGGGGRPRAGLFQEHAELLALIRDAASTAPSSARSSGWTRTPCRRATATRIHR